MKQEAKSPGPKSVAPEETENQVTVWGRPGEKFPSQYGFITYAEWCEREVARMNQVGASTSVAHHGGMICVVK